VLRPCCVELFAAVRNGLKLLVSNASAPQHEKGKRTKVEFSRNPLSGFLLAIPAGFEPATHGVEIRGASNYFNSLGAVDHWRTISRLFFELSLLRLRRLRSVKSALVRVTDSKSAIRQVR
jgi:hypothetical protein